MPPLVTSKQISRYQRDGVVLIRNLFDTHWLEVLAQGIVFASGFSVDEQQVEPPLALFLVLVFGL